MKPFSRGMGRLRFLWLMTALALASALLCMVLGIYIYWHEARILWLLAVGVGTASALSAFLAVHRLLGARRTLQELEAESTAALQQTEGARELAGFWLDCVREWAKKEHGPVRQEGAGQGPHIQNEIHALQNQMNPHFLYNTLDSIRGEAISIGAGEIAEMTEALSAFFRYSISQKGTIVTLKDELKNVDAYMQIQSFRFENRIRLETQMDLAHDPQELYVPKMILQPLVENSIVHGLERKEGAGLVTLRLTQTEKRLLISVSDDGLGMDGETLERLNRSIRSGGAHAPESKRSSGIALYNVNRRIALHFGEQYGLAVHSIPGIGTECTVTLPVVDINNVQPEYLKLVH